MDVVIHPSHSHFVARRPAKLCIPSSSQEESPKKSNRHSPRTPPKYHLQYIPPGYRTPSTCSSSGSSSPASLSPDKNGNRFNFDNPHYPTSSGYGSHHQVQTLSLKTRHRDPPKQLLSLCTQLPFSPSSFCGSSCSQSTNKQVLRSSFPSMESVSSHSDEVCIFCYQFAVHYAHNRQLTPLPRVTDRGYWRGHVIQEGGRIVCPRLLRRVCSLCGATGQSAHMNNYCPVTKQYFSSY